MDVVTEDISGFFDLNISASIQSGTTLQNVLDRAAMLGYTTVAVNVSANLDEIESVSSKKKKARKQADKEVALTDGFPDPDSIAFSAPVSSKTGRRLHVLKRVTLEFSGSGDLSRIGRSTNLKKFDILAVTPTTQNAFSTACQTLAVDIITIDHNSFRGFMLNRKMACLAQRRGVCLELLYAPALGGGAVRRTVLNCALILNSICNGKNVIVSSGACHEHQLRGPYDVPSVAHLMGLPEPLARASVSSLPKSVVFHAVGRNRTGFCMVQLLPRADTADAAGDASPAAKKRRLPPAATT